MKVLRRHPTSDEDNTDSIWQAEPSLPRLPVCRLVGHEAGPIPLVRFTGDGKYCLTAGSDRSIRLWNPSRLDPAFPPPRQQQLYSGDISDSDDIPIPLLPRALPIQVYDDGINYIPTAMAITEDTTRLFVACDKTAVLLDSVTTKVLRQFHGHVAVINDVAMLSTAAATIDVLATASYDATVCLWDGRSNSHRPIQTLKEAKDSVTCVDMSQQQAVVRTASVDGCVRTYDVRKGILQSDCYGSPITCVATHGLEGHIPTVAVSCLDGVIRVQRHEVGADFNDNNSSSNVSLPLICRNGHVAGQYALECTFSADGSVLVSGSEDGRATLYDTSSLGKIRQSMARPGPAMEARVVQELVGHTAPTCSVAAHPSHNSAIVTASYDGNCIVWADDRDFMKW